MKVSFVLIAAIAGFAAASPATPQKRDCPFLVDKALSASVFTLKNSLGGWAPPTLKDATDAGAYCFKQKVGCPVSGPLEPPQIGDAPPRDCESGPVAIGLKAAVSALKTGLGPFVPTNFQDGVDAGLTCFKEHLGCAVPSADA